MEKGKLNARNILRTDILIIIVTLYLLFNTNSSYSHINQINKVNMWKNPEN